jgi:hypothetical protein
MKALLSIHTHGSIMIENDGEYVPTIYKTTNRTIQNYYYTEMVKCGVPNVTGPEIIKQMKDSIIENAKNIFDNTEQTEEEITQANESLVEFKRDLISRRTGPVLPTYITERFYEPTKTYKNITGIIDKTYEGDDKNCGWGIFLTFENMQTFDLDKKEDFLKLLKRIKEAKGISQIEKGSELSVKASQMLDCIKRGYFFLSSILDFLDFSNLITELYIYDFSCHMFSGLDFSNERDFKNLITTIDNLPETIARGGKQKSRSKLKSKRRSKLKLKLKLKHRSKSRKN